MGFLLRSESQEQKVNGILAVHAPPSMTPPCWEHETNANTRQKDKNIIKRKT